MAFHRRVPGRRWVGGERWGALWVHLVGVRHWASLISLVLPALLLSSTHVAA